MTKYIQNLDTVLVDLKKVGITIIGIKSQFCCASIKIVGYICNFEGQFSDISKVLKILNWSECVDITAA